MQINRRTAMTLAAGAAAAGFLPHRLSFAAGEFAGRSVTFATWGGEYADSQKKSYCDPFVQKTGAQVVIDGPIDSGKLRVMLMQGNYDWHVIVGDEALMLSLAKEDLLLEVDESKVDLNRVLPQFRHKYGVFIEVGSNLVAYSTPAFEGKKAPSTWADLFDLQAYPGKRMLSNSPRGTLEIALLADGVPADKLYPLDIERALKKLDIIKDSVIFYGTNAMSQQLLTDGAVSCGFMYANRAFGAIKGGAKIGVSWEQNISESTPVFVPKGVADPDIAWALVNETLVAENQATMSKLFVTSPTNPEALELVDAETLSWLPTKEEYLKQGIASDDAYWGEHLLANSEQFQNWLLL